jgi:hypothetical protein
VSPHATTRSDDRYVVEVLEFIIRDGVFMGGLTADFLDLFFQTSPNESCKKPIALPREFLRELGAILRLALWERAGLCDRLDHGLPPAREALRDLFTRFLRVPHVWESAEVASGLALAVFDISLSRLAWAAREEVNVDVVLDEPHDKILLEGLADLLWDHRDLGRVEE